MKLTRPGSQVVYQNTINHCERICKPQKTTDLTTESIDKFIAAHSKEPGKTGSPTSPASINKEWRVLRAVANVAKDWKQLREAPNSAGRAN
ncbi:MAG: phage integrase SAM-like domain-containing protein [Pirellulaceae bacterium]|nr:phage integrase SAM-like domain-containing protein [Pirellulaceae bacterium]